MTHPDFEVTHHEFDQHQEWLELCALANSGALEPAERERLRIHLASCPQCRVALMEFQDISREAMPLVADAFHDLDDEDPEPADGSSWDTTAAREKLLAAFDQPEPSPIPIPSPRMRRPRPRWASIAPRMATAAAILLAVGWGAYQLGKRSIAPPQAVAIPRPGRADNLRQVDSLLREKDQLDHQLQAQLQARLQAETDQFATLEKQVGEDQKQIGLLQKRLEDSQSESSSALAARTNAEQQLETTAQDRDSLNAKLQAAQASYQTVEDELEKLKAQRQRDQLQYASLEVEVNELKGRLQEAETRAKDESQYLASDRDIRDLIGARNLYIADVTDLDPNGNRRAPFGRVFYTKGKSLIFYAFDLEEQPKAQLTSTFQAWARQGSDEAKPISLGILYMDSEQNRRWILRTEDPKLLDRIHTVFVTLEPRGGSQKPTGRPLLFAYLSSQAPNHP